MNLRPELIHPNARRWLATAEARQQLSDRAAHAATTFQPPDLDNRLSAEMAAARTGGPARMRLGTSLRVLSEELALLALAHSQGIAIADDAWRLSTSVYLPTLYAIDELAFQGRNATPPWKSDLTTADIALNLACALYFPSPLDSERSRLRQTILEKCVRPILADWINDETRIHSLDTMGHNWWAVIVAGAGVSCALLGDEANTSLVAEKLREWFHFKGNAFSRKRPNFGVTGDFVEGFHYAEYALSNVCLFAQVYPQFRLMPDGLNEIQARGFAGWLRNSYVRTNTGWQAQRFSDINPQHSPRLEVWHSFARATGERQLLAQAHAIKPRPDKFHEFILWEPKSNETLPRAEREHLQIHPTSGLSFDMGRWLSLSVRAGEFWNHNHLDAGTFIFCQDDVVWVDDAGTCGYGHPDYLDYFVTPAAHNVAYAPKLSPPLRHAFREGMSATGHYVSTANDPALGIIGVDTGILSGSALSRSYRWFFRLGNDGLLIWDDLSAYQPHEFVSLLNTDCLVERIGQSNQVHLLHGEKTCAVTFFSDAPAELSLTSIKRGENPNDPSQSLTEGRTCLNWRTREIERLKLGVTIGTQFRNTIWSGSRETGGWVCEIASTNATWTVWFNPLADGANTHQPCTSRWREFETDAYALVLKNQEGVRMVAAIEASFVRRDGKVIGANLARQPLTVIPLRA